ncbi:phosphopyruvate hydratase [Pseudomonas sp. GM21]|uniref:phosphopyruvate hydratase n=1 Tax=Pseudomonas sp. GM21 TaxID=1144325 RepID=UPI000272590E|nr:phosphopyruvate hydratase [Pseudomonas sp. GM21]EJM22918.1 phosphopyruvate hydratase [Pseudomonas sp. GM21]
MANPTISSVHARQILDSRGRPTVEVDVLLSDGSLGRAAVPSGASTGAAEAHELRDGNANYYEGRSVLNAVAHVNGEISRALAGKLAFEQNAIDALLLNLDGTAQLKRLGANAILGCSLAVCRASAVSARQPLYQRIAELAGITTLSMPMPMVNILSGGLHAGRGMDVQDFLAIPASATSMEEAIHNVSRMRSAATRVMQRRGLTTLLADEGGLSPGLKTGREALELMVAAAEEADLEPGKDMVIAIDVAASSLKGPNGSYRFAKEGRDLNSDQVIDMLDGWVRDFPIVSIEDGLDEEDWQGWVKLTSLLGNKVRLIGDDLFSTNLDRLQRGINGAIANGVLVKVNQNGTLSGTLEVIAEARREGYAPVVSARSGETEDDFIADLAVGTAAGQIKIGSVRCSDRLSKYNQLLRIEEQSRAAFAGMSAIRIGV